MVETKKEDTRAKLRSHAFWDALLPIFDKYYKQIDSGFTLNEISQGIKTLESLTRFSPITSNEAYESYESERLGYGKKFTTPKQLLRQLIQRVYWKFMEYLG
jgi:hypothetical protein